MNESSHQKPNNTPAIWSTTTPKPLEPSTAKALQQNHNKTIAKPQKTASKPPSTGENHHCFVRKRLRCQGQAIREVTAQESSILRGGHRLGRSLWDVWGFRTGCFGVGGNMVSLVLCFFFQGSSFLWSVLLLAWMFFVGRFRVLRVIDC